jgi:multiple sugar transport system permease protein
MGAPLSPQPTGGRFSRRKSKSYNALDRPGLGLLLALPVILLLLFVIVLPELWAIVLSLTDYRPGREITFVGLDNYTRILTDPYFINALGNTLRFIFFGVLLQLVFGTGFALLLARGFRFQKLWIALILAPSAMSPAILGTTWKYIFNADFGPLNYALFRMGIDAPYWFTNATFAFIGLMLVYAWNTIPQTFIFVYPALISIPAEYHEAAAIDGANKWQSFRHVTFPLILPALTIAMVFRTIVAVRAFGEVLVLTGGGPFRSTEVLSIYLYKEGFVYFSWGTAAAVGWVILVITMIVAIPQIRLLARQMNEQA